MPLIWILVAAGLTAAMIAYTALSRRPAIADRLDRYAGSVDEAPQGPSVFESWQRFLIRAIAPKVEKLLPTYYLELIRADLRRAGYTSRMHFNLYLAIQGLCTGLGVMVGLAVGVKYALAAAAVVGLVASMLPILGLKMQVKKRQTAINASLPDTIDLLTACVEAGLGLDSAVGQLISRRSKANEAINVEFNRYLQELQMGVPRPEALRNLAARSDVEDLRHVVTALLQGDALGVGVSQILRAQAQHLRIRRRQRAEERAMKAPIKIVFPLAFCIFPSIFIVILGPASLIMLDNFIGKL